MNLNGLNTSKFLFGQTLIDFQDQLEREGNGGDGSATACIFVEWWMSVAKFFLHWTYACNQGYWRSKVPDWVSCLSVWSDCLSEVSACLNEDPAWLRCLYEWGVYLRYMLECGSCLWVVPAVMKAESLLHWKKYASCAFLTPEYNCRWSRPPFSSLLQRRNYYQFSIAVDIII